MSLNSFNYSESNFTRPCSIGNQCGGHSEPDFQVQVGAILFFTVLLSLAYKLINEKIIERSLARKEEEDDERKAFVKEALVVHRWNDKTMKEKVAALNDKSCAICFEPYKPRDKVCWAIPKDDQNKEATVCNHVFHTECIRKWLWHSSDCPICRTIFLGNKESPLFLRKETLGIDEEGQQYSTLVISTNNENQSDNEDNDDMPDQQTSSRNESQQTNNSENNRAAHAQSDLQTRYRHTIEITV